jgi:hypothetical protein
MAFTLRWFLYPEERFVWVKIRLLHETDKAILVQHYRKSWIPKSKIYGIKLMNNTFEIYVKERAIG